MDFQRYNIKEKQKEKGRKKKNELLKNKQTNKQKKPKQNTNNHPKSIYDVCLKKKKVFFLKNSNTRL